MKANIHPNAGRRFCIICEILAGNLFALFSGLLCSLILTYDEVGADFRARLKTVMRWFPALTRHLWIHWFDRYMHSNNVDRGVQMKVRRFLERLFQNQANEQAKTALLTWVIKGTFVRDFVDFGICWTYVVRRGYAQLNCVVRNINNYWEYEKFQFFLCFFPCLLSGCSERRMAFVIKYWLVLWGRCWDTISGSIWRSLMLSSAGLPPLWSPSGSLDLVTASGWT